MSFENRLQTGKHSYLVSGFGCDSDPYFYTFLLISCTFHRAISNIHWHHSRKKKKKTMYKDPFKYFTASFTKMQSTHYFHRV